jgi:HSP20 family protein
MNDYDNRGTERGSIENRRGRQGISGMFDWDPFRSLFPGSFQHTFGVEVTRSDDGYEIEVPVPGYRSEDLDISYQDGVITVSGRTERRSFTRAIMVPDDIDEEQMQARVENGMLIMTLKQHPARQPKRISIGTPGEKQIGSQTSTGETRATGDTRAGAQRQTAT